MAAEMLPTARASALVTMGVISPGQGMCKKSLDEASSLQSVKAHRLTADVIFTTLRPHALPRTSRRGHGNRDVNRCGAGGRAVRDDSVDLGNSAERQRRGLDNGVVDGKLLSRLVW